MLTEQSASQLRDVLAKSNSVFIFLGQNPQYDDVASALSLYLSLQDQGKQVQIMSPRPMRVEFSHLVGVDEIVEKLGNRNLVVSFEYVESAVDKVSYSISPDNTRFNLIIAPKSGAKPLNPEGIEYSYAGLEADMIFCIGMNSFDELGELYQLEKTFFDSAVSIALNHNQAPVAFAKTMIDAQNLSSLSEGMVMLLSSVVEEPMDDVATNLLSAIELATNRFQSLGMTAELFELVARLLRNGARRSTQNPVFSQTSSPQAIVQHQLPLSEAPREVVTQPSMQTNMQSSQAKSNGSVPALASALKAAAKRSKGVIQRYPVKNQVTTTTTQPAGVNPPQEWLQPKVYTGASTI